MRSTLVAGVWGMARDSRLSLSLHPCMIADFQVDDEPLAQELNEVVDIIQSNSRDIGKGGIL